MRKLQSISAKYRIFFLLLHYQKKKDLRRVNTIEITNNYLKKKIQSQLHKKLNKWLPQQMLSFKMLKKNHEKKNENFLKFK